MPNVFFFRPPSFFLDPRTGRPRYARIFLILLVIAAAAFTLPRVVTNVYKQHNTKANIAQQDMDAIGQGLALYKHDNGNYPSAEQGLLALVLEPTRGPAAKGWKQGGYIDRLPHDPWGNPYQYRFDETEQTYRLFSFGAGGPDAADEDGEGDSVIVAR
ncbi:MAG: ral secretion pathway protein [Herbaspirillum sp.]|jgi:general secretion pathway protein G|nr:ral secretion pathway protein [Herbaspirillum sp.]